MRSPSPRRQTLSGIDEPTREPIDPEPTVGVEHDLNDGSVFEPKRDRRAKRGAQHARATRRRLLIEMVDCHFRPPLDDRQLAAAMSGAIRKGRTMRSRNKIRSGVVLWRRKTCDGELIHRELSHWFDIPSLRCHIAS